MMQLEIEKLESSSGKVVIQVGKFSMQLENSIYVEKSSKLSYLTCFFPTPFRIFQLETFQNLDSLCNHLKGSISVGYVTGSRPETQQSVAWTFSRRGYDSKKQNVTVNFKIAAFSERIVLQPIGAFAFSLLPLSTSFL